MDVREKLEVIAHLGDHITYKEDIGICYDSDLAKVIEDAYMTLKNGVTVQEWISVKDRLPNYGELVIVIDKYSCIFFGTRYERLGELIFQDVGGHFASTGVAWMPPPEPPKGE